jgi:hypothetical protein
MFRNYSTTVYVYQQITRVLLVDTSGGYFTLRYSPVYAKSLNISKGVDNVLLFEFINQDQKPVNITGSNFVFRVMNQTGDSLLLEKPMEILAASVGRVKAVITAEETLPWVAQPASYSIQRAAGNYVQAVFVNADSQARADCNIMDSVLPTFVPSSELTIPTIYGKEEQVQPGPTSWPDWALQPQPQNSTMITEFYSSHIDTSHQNLTTIKMDMDHYTGTVKFQAAQDYESVWYDVTENWNFLDETSTQYFNVIGFYPLIRACFNNSQGYGASATANVDEAGVVTSINLTNAGSDYLAPPRVQILGNGAGAAAVATIGITGQVSDIIVTAGGSGYTPIQVQSSQRATVLITTGTITNLQYR